MLVQVLEYCFHTSNQEDNASQDTYEEIRKIIKTKSPVDSSITNLYVKQSNESVENTSKRDS